jgi:hypothetical protein
MAEIDAAAQDTNDLRQRASDRSMALVRQLEADRADLQHWKERYKAPGADAGIEAVARVIEAATRLREQLQGG